MPKGNGKNPSAPPGQAGTSPGQSGNTPGQSGNTPGQGGGAPPGQTGSTPGQSGTTPGQNQNQAPTAILLDNMAIDENNDGGVIGNLSVVDPDSGDSHTLSVDDPRFEIIGGVLRLKAGESLDFEAEQTVTLNITAEDLAGATVVQQIVIDVNDLNEAPDAGADVLASAAEDVSDTTVLASVTATDPDLFADGVTSFNDLGYSIVGGNGGGHFEIDSSGNISLAAGQSLDFETAGQHVLTIEVSDGGGLTDTVQVTIDVDDVNEAPDAGTDIVTSADEDVSDAVILASVNATDPDIFADGINSFNDLSYSIISGDGGGLFEIDSSGNISLASGQSLDFETSDQHVLTVEVSDSGGLTDTVQVTVDVNDVPEGGGGTTSTVIGPVFQMNTTTAQPQSAQGMATLTNGNVVAVWGSGIHAGPEALKATARIFDPAGNPVSAEIPLGPGQPDAGQVNVEALPGGGFVAVWADIDNNSSHQDVHYQRFQSDGTPIDATPQLINTGITGDPEVAVFSDGSFMIVYQDDGGGGDNVKGRVIDSSGVPGPEFPVAADAGTPGLPGQGSPRIALLSDGNVAVTYSVDPAGGGDGSGFGLFMKILDSSGTVLSAEIPVNTTTAGDQTSSQITSIGGDQFVVTWHDNGPTGDMHARIFANDGTPAGPDFLVNTETAGAQSAPGLVALPDGGFFITWSDGLGTGPFDLVGQRFDSTGARIGEELVIDSGFTASPTPFGQMTVLTGGSIFLAYNPVIAGDSDVGGRIIVFDTGSGTSASETIVSGSADSMLSGNGGNDTFVFANDGSHNTITDFVATPGAEQDQIDVTAFGFDAFSGGTVNIIDALDFSGPAPVLTLGTGSVTLTGVDPLDLDQNDFIF